MAEEKKEHAPSKEGKKQKQVKRIVVDIFGDTYAFKTDEPESLEGLAAKVDERMKKAARSVQSFDNKQIAVLAALQIAEEYAALKKDYDELVELLNEK